MGGEGGEELSLFVARVVLTLDVGLLIVLDDFAPFAHFFDTGAHLHAANHK